MGTLAGLLVVIRPAAGQSVTPGTTSRPALSADLTEMDSLLTQAIDAAGKGYSALTLMNKITRVKLGLVDAEMTQPIDGVKGSAWFHQLDCVDVELQLAKYADKDIPFLTQARNCKETLESDLFQAALTQTQPQQALAPNTVFDGCVAINPQGNTTTLSVAVTVSNPEPGNYTAAFAQSPSGPLTGSGTATNGANPIVVPITATAFGTYGQLSLTAPDGNPVQPGPLTQQLPLTLNASTDKPNGCNPVALKTRLPGPPASRSDVKAVTSFLDVRLAHDFATGDVGDELATLNSVVIDLFGADQCRSLLGTLTDPTAVFTVKEVTGPIPYDYPSNGLTTAVPNTFFVDVTRTQHGQPQDQTVHVARGNNGSLSWFTACGTPLNTAK